MARLASLLLLGAAAVSAHPSHMRNHAHKHRAAEAKRNIGDKICAKIDGVETCWTQETDYYSGAAAATPTPTPSPAVAIANMNAVVQSKASTTVDTPTSAAPAAGGDSSTGSNTTTITTGNFVDTYTDFADVICKDTTSKRATLAQIQQVGNTGGSCYGSNFLVVTDKNVADKYHNTITNSGATKDMICAYWNKASRTGEVNGWYKNSNSYFTFDLAAGSNVWLALEDGSNGAVSCFPASTGIEFDKYGAIAGTWLEFTFVDTTTGWSAYDASCIIAENAGLTINGLEVCKDDGTTCSSIGAGLSSISAAFNALLAAADGIGGNFDGTLKIKANWGF